MLTEWEKNDRERGINMQLYGVNESDATIAIRVALEATKALAKGGGFCNHSPLLQKWYADHRRMEEEAEKVVADREARIRLRSETIAKLSPQELEALGVKA